MRQSLPYLIAALLCLAWSVSAQADVAVFQEDISPTNTYQAGAIDISTATPNDNRELALNPIGDPLPTLLIGRVSGTNRDRGLFFFDLSSIPTGSTINSVSFSLFAQRKPNGDSLVDTASVDQNFDIYLHQLVGSITEGDPTTYSISGPSWNSRDISTATAWTTPGGDYNSTVLSTLTANPRQLVGGQAYTWNSTSDFVAAAQGALNGSGVLYMLARASSEDLALRGQFRFMSDDQAPNNSAVLSDVHTNPILTVDYTASAPQFLAGDFNLDHHVNAADILPMELALTNLSNYKATYAPGITDPQLALIEDVNSDGSFNNADLQYLLTTLNSGGGSTNPVPEPATALLLGLGGLLAWRRIA